MVSRKVEPDLARGGIGDLEPHLDPLAQRERRTVAAGPHRRVAEHNGATLVPGLHDGCGEHLTDPGPQQPRLGQVDAGPLESVRRLARRRHLVGERGQRRHGPVGHGGPRAERQADLGGVAVGEAAQRCRDVRVRARRCRVATLVGRGRLAVERSVLARRRGAARPRARRRRPRRVGSDRARPAHRPPSRLRATAPPGPTPGGAEPVDRSRWRGAGRVRSRPTPPSIMRLAAAMPVTSDSCTFQVSTSSDRRNSTV